MSSIDNKDNRINEISVNSIIHPIIDTIRNYLYHEMNLILKEEDQVHLVTTIQVKDISAMIDINGILHGVVLISVEDELAETMVKTMILDELTSEEIKGCIDDVIAEFTNLVVGNSINQFPVAEELINIDPPVPMKDQTAILKKFFKSKMWCQTLSTSIGNIKVNFIGADDKVSFI